MRLALRSALRRRTVVMIVAAGAVALYALTVTVLLSRASAAARAGERAASRAERHVTPKGVLAGTPNADLRRAERSFRHSASLTATPILTPLKILPVAGRQIVAAHAIARTAATATHAIAVAGDDVRHLIKNNEAPVGADRVRFFTRVARIAEDTQRQIDTTDLGPRRGLLRSLARAHNRVAGKLDKVDRALIMGGSGARALAELLAGPHRYLVVAANNSEMRAGSGMWLQGGELATDHGALRLTGMRSLPDDAPLPPDAVTADGDLGARWGYLHPGREWRNLMLSPRFDVNAALAARMWVAAGNQAVDGVLCIDPVVLQAILRATGPVEATGRKIRAKDVLDELLHDQYLRFPTKANRDLLNRRERLGEIALAAFTAFDRGGWDVAKLTTEMAHAAAGRHVMVWSANPESQRQWEHAGVAGTIDGRSLLVAVENRGGNKLDHFLAVDVDTGVVTRKDAFDLTLRIRLRNRTPAGEPPYVAGAHVGSGGKDGDYVGIVSVTMPGVARDFRIDGVTGYAVLGPDGPTNVMAIGVTVPQGQEQTVVAHLSVPRPTRGKVVLSVPSSARLPALSWRRGDHKWRDRGFRSLPLP
jgi:hypothetical protein